VARKGVTGARTQIDQSLEAFIARCRKVTPLPLGLGFGLRTGADLQRIRDHIDIAIIGTALLEAWEQGGATQYEKLLREMATAAA
jgi:tryptophan synthase alpha chain